jgi:hypothetical protein
MKNPVYEQIQAKKVKARLRILQHAKRLSGSVSQTCRFFGVSGALYYIWKKCYEKNGLAGLRDQPRRTTQHPVSHSTGNCVADPSHSGRASLRCHSIPIQIKQGVFDPRLSCNIGHSCWFSVFPNCDLIRISWDNALARKSTDLGDAPSRTRL